MEEFKCIVGCVECCISENLIIPITLGDLYRQWVYDFEIKGQKGKKFYDVFEERCNRDKLFFEPISGKWLHFFKSKIPCYNVDFEKRGCGVHALAQYLVCSFVPEQFFLPEYHDFSDIGLIDSRSFFESLSCIKNKTLSGEIQKKIRNLYKLFLREMKITGEFLEEKSDIIKEIKWVSSLDYGDFRECIWPTIEQTQLAYMELMDIDPEKIDYTSLKTLDALFF